MGQTTDLIRQAQVISYTPATSGRSHQSRVSPPPDGSRRDHSPPDDAHQRNNNDAHRNGEMPINVVEPMSLIVVTTKLIRVQTTISAITFRCEMYVTASTTEQPTRTSNASSMILYMAPRVEAVFPHLREVIWSHNFKLEKLKKYDGKENPENWITLHEIAVRSAIGDEHMMANYFPVVLDQASHQWLLDLPENQFDTWGELR